MWVVLWQENWEIEACRTFQSRWYDTAVIYKCTLERGGWRMGIELHRGMGTDLLFVAD